LRLPGGFEPLHAPFPLARRLVGILCPIVQVAVLAVFHAGHELPLRCPLARQLIRDDHPRDIAQTLEQLAEELFCCGLIATALNQNIQHVAVLIHRTPEVMALPLDGQKDFIQVPFISGLGVSTP
jgi:hypothetical protein